MKFDVNTLLFDKDLVYIKCSASRVSKTKTCAGVLLVDLPQCWVVVDTFGGEAVKFGPGLDCNFGVCDNPLFLLTNFDERKFFDALGLGVKCHHSCSGTVAGQARSNQFTACLANDLVCAPNSKHGANSKV